MSFFLSKFLWYFFNPFALFIFIFCIGFIFLIFKKYKISTYILSIALFCILMISIFPIGKFGIYLLEKEFHFKQVYPDKIDGILILSGATDPYLSKEYNSIELNSSAERLTESIFLINKYKKAKIVFSGGSGYLRYPNLDHAKVARKFFNKMNVNNKKIIYENKSRNTYENIVFSKKIAEPKKDEVWLLVTSASHMKRAILISQKQQWVFIPYPVDFNQPQNVSLRPSMNFLSNLVSFQKAFHEWLGLYSYYLLGRIDKFF
tara:strand:- start:2405 stop:3187 length:783 start_codon:yes stop_codon:yes gene_type:complete